MKIKSVYYELPGLRGKYAALREAFMQEAVAVSKVDSNYLPSGAIGEILLMPDGLVIQIEELSDNLVRMNVSSTGREPDYVTKIVKRFGQEMSESSWERPLRPDQRLEQILNRK